MCSTLNKAFHLKHFQIKPCLSSKNATEVLLGAAFGGALPMNGLGVDHTKAGTRSLRWHKLDDVNMLMQPYFRSSSEIFLQVLSSCRWSQREHSILLFCLCVPVVLTANFWQQITARLKSRERKTLCIPVSVPLQLWFVPWFLRICFVLFFQWRFSWAGYGMFPFPSELKWDGITGLIYELINWFSTASALQPLWTEPSEGNQCRGWLSLQLIIESLFHILFREMQEPFPKAPKLGRKAHHEHWRWECGTSAHISYYLFVLREYVGVLVITFGLCFP